MIKTEISFVKESVDEWMKEYNKPDSTPYEFINFFKKKLKNKND